MLEQIKTILTQQRLIQWVLIVVTVWVLLTLLEYLGHFLKSTMRRRLVSFKWRTLTRKGFLIAPDPRQKQRLLRRLNRYSKHPAVLVAVGFVLTGIIGNGLVALQEHLQRERESLVKSMSELRTAYDDLSVGFADYSYRGRLLISLQEHGATPNEIAEARKTFDAASEKWQERLVADSPTIATLHQFATGDYGALTITEDMKVATDLVDDCITNNRQVHDPSSTQLVLECMPKKDGVTASMRLGILSNCMKVFSMFLRPDPRLDLYVNGDNPAIKRASGVLETACDVKRYFETIAEISNAMAGTAPSARTPTPPLVRVPTHR
ncbi:hypothetical protein [Paraburkholderia megapolitana]|uniref:Uncharacterized protein n=1 Tax=Paraburkholderia megapolitana TaxID=420953 RepID=A0A1I3RVL1_9BURK|nr:hypothetical protein [Paraburkholderia megapolitana]QDQ84033.1 hypothetical protein FNZ07_23155 [Paraburkholderia megapolitana]SFJ49459.1 hypothetical protein SAMN05192543_107418 [Paraburkholderia megapolitana]